MSWPGLSRPLASLSSPENKVCPPHIGERSDAVLWTAKGERARRERDVLIRAAVCAAISVACLLGADLASAQDYPNRPVKVVVPFPAGGGTDALTRVVAKGMEQRLGQPFIVENRGGAGTTLGATAVARSDPDG